MSASDDYARGMWWWMTPSYKREAAWCEKHCRGKWTMEIDAAAFGFALREDYVDFKHAFPRRSRAYEAHADLEGR